MGLPFCMVFRTSHILNSLLTLLRFHGPIGTWSLMHMLKIFSFPFSSYSLGKTVWIQLSADSLSVQLSMSGEKLVFMLTGVPFNSWPLTSCGPLSLPGNLITFSYFIYAPAPWVRYLISFSPFSSLSHNPYSQLAAYVMKRRKTIRRGFPHFYRHIYPLNCMCVHTLSLPASADASSMLQLCTSEHFRFSTSSQSLSSPQGHCSFRYVWGVGRDLRLCKVS